MDNEAVVGINVPEVTEWFETHADGVVPPLTFQLIAGGHSNLTFRVTDRGGRSWVLRRPPLPEDAASVGQAFETFAAADHDLRELLVAITGTMAFRYRAPASGEVTP